ncbi:BQ5605_C001g00232 [Microbotryum silenes-dioicae]|uniref:BQ5605_C001g00232 protein n=1 Tax=Microbotryum silenes-dioicae TaxID=796604 RepID=A0A2X0MQ38_9BASI|nr:BQ5605_C001g00232 [Microbotryum silenes-dioicae]
MMNMMVTLRKSNNDSLPWLPKSKLAGPIYAQWPNGTVHVGVFVTFANIIRRQTFTGAGLESMIQHVSIGERGERLGVSYYE